VLSCTTAFLVGASAVGAALLVGDLDGDGLVDTADEAWLASSYGNASSDPGYEPASDFNSDGATNVRDLALFGASFGASGGPTDTTPPSLLVTLNDVPDDMNDLLVVPPDGFQITLLLDGAGGSVIDPASLSITSSEDMGAQQAGTELASLFSVNPTRALWEVPAGSELARTSHYLTASIRDAAGNLSATGVYGYAVRDFPYGAPLGNPQTVFLDFDQDRSLTSEIDLIEDLQEYGLSSAVVTTYETQMRDRVVSEVLTRTHAFYGSPGPDGANIVFVDSDPGGTHARLCVGGESAQGANFLGAEQLDVHNINEGSDHCGASNLFGVWPQAIDNLWGGDGTYQATFFPIDPDEGGTPVGEDPLDATVLAPGFDPLAATTPEFNRWLTIQTAVAAFSQAVATAVAHETGHTLGLVAHGPAPGGLYGGDTGSQTDHNVTPTGGTPAGNFVMNQGTSFSFDEITGMSGESLPVFRPLGWAYLRDRVVLDSQVTGLFPPPVLSSVTPNPVDIAPPQSATVTLHGADFLATPTLVELIGVSGPLPQGLLNLVFVDPQTVTGAVNKFLHPPGTYDVRLVNADGQEVTLIDGLEIQ
jgi:hypothetical protein